MTPLATVLVVDDDPILCAIAQSYFEGRGASEILAAENGRRAIEILEARGREIDFILCDLNMPELDGVEFLRLAKACRYEGLICILSSEDKLVIETAHKLAGAHGLHVIGAIQKPLESAKLDSLIAEAEPRPKQKPAKPGPGVTCEELASALAQGHVLPFYQPKIDLHSGRIVGVEALARWMHPQKGLIGPDLFIPLAEENGLIGALTDRIFHQALADTRTWRRQGIVIKPAINVTSDLIKRLDFPDRLTTLTERFGLSPADVTLEITETSLLERNEILMEVLARLRLKGFNTSIDDFGTGFSNMEQLRAFPFSELKIDRSFIQGACQDRFSRVTVEASVLMGRELNMQIVAEGVETREDLAFVVGCGIDEMQGFYIAKPTPAEAFAEWHSRNGGAAPAELVGGIIPAGSDAEIVAAASPQETAAA